MGMYELAKELFPICRSITGNGVRATLQIIKREIPQLQIHAVKSGTKVFDWVIPDEWNIEEAYIEDESGKRLIDFQENNLHVMGYSEPVDKWVDKEELLRHIFSLPEQPDYIPYVTSYYKKQYGFCMTDNMRKKLENGTYHILIKSSFKVGELNYGEIIIPGRSKKEVFLSTYICHPSMANNELSGPCVLVNIAKYLQSLPDRRYTYRLLFTVETIGAITYLQKNLEQMKENVIAGFNISCVGDDRTYSYVESRYGHTLSDRVCQNVLKYHYPEYKRYTYLDWGSDERQYCAPGVDLPVCAICRSKYGEYAEYHTSADDLSLISEEGLEGAYKVYVKCINALEYNYKYKIKCLCEPQLGKRGLYPTVSKKNIYDEVRKMTNFIAYADGNNDLIEISDRINVSIEELIPIIDRLEKADLLIRGEENAGQ